MGVAASSPPLPFQACPSQSGRGHRTGNWWPFYEAEISDLAIPLVLPLHLFPCPLRARSLSYRIKLLRFIGAAPLFATFLLIAAVLQYCSGCTSECEISSPSLPRRPLKRPRPGKRHPLLRAVLWQILTMTRPFPRAAKSPLQRTSQHPNVRIQTIIFSASTAPRAPPIRLTQRNPTFSISSHLLCTYPTATPTAPDALSSSHASYILASSSPTFVRLSDPDNKDKFGSRDSPNFIRVIRYVFISNAQPWFVPHFLNPRFPCMLLDSYINVVPSVLAF